MDRTVSTAARAPEQSCVDVLENGCEAPRSMALGSHGSFVHPAWLPSLWPAGNREGFLAPPPQYCRMQGGKKVFCSLGSVSCLARNGFVGTWFCHGFWPLGPPLAALADLRLRLCGVSMVGPA